MARPSTLTQAIHNLIVNSIKKGNYRETAFRLAKVPKRTFCRWIANGKKKSAGIYHNFYEAVIEAEGYAEHVCVDVILKAAKVDARHAEWWLERKFPERWARERHEVHELRRQVADLLTRLDAVDGKGKASG